MKADLIRRGCEAHAARLGDTPFELSIAQQL
jgi:hypothetical protein